MDQVKFSVQRQDQSQRVLRNRVWPICRDIFHFHSHSPARLKIYIIRTSASQDHQLDAHLSQLLCHLRSYAIVDKQAEDGDTMADAETGFTQTTAGELDVDAKAFIFGEPWLEEELVVGL